MKYFLLLLSLLPLKNSKPADTHEAVIIHRMEALVQMRDEIMERAWPETTGPFFSIPFIYYTDSACYVANPTERFLRQYKCELKHRSKKVTIFKAPGRIDGIPFHMEVHVSDNDKDFNYQFPYGRISGFDETKKYAPELPAAAWSGMILHEFFHGYQFRHREYWQYATEKKLIFSVINDSLQGYYARFAWYKKSVDQENALILQAIREKNKAARNKLVTQMFALRDDRRKLAEDTLNRPVTFYESGFETMEGTARYIEEATVKLFPKVKFPHEFLETDTSFANAISKASLNPDIAHKTEVSQKYTYAIGFNMSRLLDVYGSNYKSRLFREPELTLEKLLREEVKKR